MLESHEPSRSRVVTPALLAIVLIAAVRADASTLVMIGQARTGQQTLRQFSSFAKVVQRLVEVAGDRDRICGSGICTSRTDESTESIFVPDEWQRLPDHRVRDEMLALPPPR